MTKFALNDKDFDSRRQNVSHQDNSYEIVKLDSTYYALFEHLGDSVREIECFTYEEMKAIWNLLSNRE